MTTVKKGPPQFARGTTVPVEKSQIEVQKLLKSYGATQTAHAEQKENASILFTMKQRQYRIILPYPPLSDFQYDNRQVRRSKEQAAQARAQELRRLWRALLLVVKSKLEAVSSRIMTFEQEFYYHTVLNNNQTIGEWNEQQIAQGNLLLLPGQSTSWDNERPDILLLPGKE